MAEAESLGMNIKELLDDGIRILKEHDIPNERVDAWELLEMVTGMDRTRFFLHEADEVDDEAVDRYFKLIDRRAGHYPLQYLTGYQEFMGYKFRVNENVLIPRMDTECLVEEVERRIRRAVDAGVLTPNADAGIMTNVDAKEQSLKVLDMCTGSGCIAISIKKRNACYDVDAVDISGEALEVAKQNAKDLQAEVNFTQSDLFANVNGKYDVIVSNPPYIPTKVIGTLMPEVRDYEPGSALDGMEDGLYFYRKIIAAAKNYLNESGMLLFEIGCEQGRDVTDLMKEAGFRDCEVVKDLAGLDRIVYGGMKDV